MEKKEKETPIVTRRGFIVGGTLTALHTGMCLCAVTGCSSITGKGKTPKIRPDAYSIGDGPTVTIDIAEVPSFREVGGSVKIIDERLPDDLIVVRAADDIYIAASLYCTHRGVELEYDNEDKNFVCASAGRSRFQLDGKNISGSADKPIATYPTKETEGMLTVYFTW
jgi:nitrite reductase/ring-hydroxylating ferredoxin subunit